MVLRPVVSLLAAAASLCAQSLPGLLPTPKNLDFSEGEVGAAPPGWMLGAENQHTEIAAGPVCDGSPRCVVVSSLRDGITATGARLFQLLDATAYRGQMVTLRAAVRTEVPAGNSARLLVRVHNDRGGVTEYGARADEAITSPHWNFYKVNVPIYQRSVYLEVGAQLTHRGTVWMDSVSLTTQPRSVRPPNDDDAIRELMRSFAAARNSGNGGDTAQNYAEEGAYLAVDGTRVMGREALARMWTAGLYGGGPARRTVEKIDFVSANIALVRGRAEFETQPARNETFVVVRDSVGGWKIQLHEPAIAK